MTGLAMDTPLAGNALQVTDMPSKELPTFDRMLLSELARGAQKTFDNADALYREAKLLGAAGALDRALFLHQISLEECAKIEIMGAWVTSLLAGYTVDEKRVLADFLGRSADKAS